MNLLWPVVFYFVKLVSLSKFAESGIVVYDGGHDIEDFTDIELPFSKPISRNGIEGGIVCANPPDACSNISGPPNENISLNWFVLVAGNLCDYDTKVMYSELAGYSAAVIYSMRGKDDGPYGHRHDFISSNSNISAVAIRTSSGHIIKENYLYTDDKRYRLYIYPNNTFNIMAFLLLFAILAGVFIIIVLSFMVSDIADIQRHACKSGFFCAEVFFAFITAAFLILFFAIPLGIVRFVQYAHTNQSNLLSSRRLQQLQTAKFQKGDPYETCAICLEDYKEKEKLRILPCLHGYHASCIDPWLTHNKRTCPVCKQTIVMTGDSYESENETAPLISSSSGRHLYHGAFNDSSLSENVYLEQHGNFPYNNSDTTHSVISNASIEISNEGMTSNVEDNRPMETLNLTDASVDGTQINSIELPSHNDISPAEGCLSYFDHRNAPHVSENSSK